MFQADAQALTRADGARRVEITGLGGSLQNPCFSPDGQRLAITQWTSKYNGGPAVVHTVPRAGGAPLARLSVDDADSVNMPGSCWNRQSGLVVFSSDPVDRDQAFVVPGEGGEPRSVTGPPEVVFEPTFSPDGQWIVYESHRNGERGEIWKVRLDGTGYTRLTSGRNDRQPNWSPAGDRIVFQRHGRGPTDLWTVSPDGGAPRQVTRTPDLEETDVSFSPSGRYLVYSSDGDEVDVASLFTIRVDGRGRKRLTRAKGIYDGAPAWSPDGRTIAFESARGDPDRSRGSRIWTISAPSNSADPL